MKMKNISTMIFFFLLFSISSSFISGVKADVLPDLTISSIQISPPQPFQNQSFIITVTVTNQGITATQGFVQNITIYRNNVTLGNMVNFVSCAFFEPLDPNTVIVFQWNSLTGLEKLESGNYIIVVNVDPFNAVEESNENNNRRTLNFTVFTTLKLTIMSDVNNAQIIAVNGTLFTTDASGKAEILFYQPGAYEVQIITPYSLNPTTRVSFVQWNDGTTNNQKTIIMDSNKTYSITTKTQYYLSVTSPYGNTLGSGWYDSGSEASFSVSPTTVSAGFLTYNVFKSWSGDYTGTGNAATITMNSPEEIVAQWATDSSQLYLAIGALALVIIIIAILLMRRRKPTSK
jgi:hypothetical protein